MKKVSEINPNFKMDISKEKVTLPVQPQKDVASISGKISADKTKNLKESAKLLKFKYILNKSARELASVFKCDINDFNSIGPLKLKTASDTEIINKVRTVDCEDTKLRKGKGAFSFFKNDIYKIFQPCNSENIKVDTILSKIEKLFQNNDFSKIVNIGEYDEDGGDYAATTLAGITKGNQMIGISAKQSC